MTPTDPANRPPSRPPRPATPPPLPPAAGRRAAGQPPASAAGHGEGRSRAAGGAHGDVSPRVAGNPAAPVVDARLLVLVALAAAIGGGGIIALVGFSGPRPNPEVAVSPPPPPVVAPVPPAPPPQPAPAPAGPSPEELAAEKAGLEKEAAQREAEAKKNARLQAFREFKTKLEQARHLPLKAEVNLESQEAQTIELCELGPAEVEVGLPALPPLKLVADKPEWNLACQGEPGGPWLFTWKDDDETHELARAQVQDEGERRTLSLKLLELPAVKDPVWVAGRQALTTAALVLRLPGSQSPADTETFVQLCSPTRMAPLRFENLLTDRRWLPSGKTPGESVECHLLPESPWPWRVELEGRGPDGITAVVEAASLEPKRIVAQAQPLIVTARWTWSGEPEKPFMETRFAFQDADVDGDVDPEAKVAGGGGTAEIRVIDSKVLPPWNAWQRLGDLKEAGGDPPPDRLQLPPSLPAFFKQGAPLADDIPIGIFASYSDIARQYVPRLTHKEVQGWLAGTASQTVKVGLEDWRQIIRATLRNRRGFKTWIHRVAPPVPANNRDENGVYLYSSDREAREKKHAQYAEAGHEVVQEYWDSLKNDATRRGAEREEVILCCLYFEFEPVLNDKRNTKRLLETVGDGTVELAGSLWVVPEAAGKHRVLLAEFGSPAIRAANRSPPIPPLKAR